MSKKIQYYNHYNELKSFKVNSLQDANNAIKRFESDGTKIKTAYYVEKKDGRIIKNIRIK